MTKFNNVHPALGQALDKRGYVSLTPVQESVLVPELKDADLLVSAQTGSGKTVAFGLAMAPTLLDGAERFAATRKPLALAVAPTRELALQVKRELQWLFEMTGASLATCVGGMDMREERRVLDRGAHIVVGTPGRLRDHIERHSLDVSGLKAVVLDEADEMLDLGFRDDLEFILGAASSDRRTLMFSATVPQSIASLARRYQRDAVRVSTKAEREQHIDIEYRALTVAPRDQENAIVNVLRYVDAKNALVFCSTRAAVNRMTSRFGNRGFSVVALSGELSQNERTHALQALRDSRARVCIATDVAARGLDLPDLELVIHAEIPKNRESLLHRSGRTGRAGRKGLCVLIVPNNERRRTERLLDSANVTAAWVSPPSADDIKQKDRERILQDPSLDEPVSKDEAAFAKQLLSDHSAEQVAAAFLRLHSAGKSAPEELLAVADVPESKQKQRRKDFTDGVWFSISVGHRQKAEARWLLPMLCRVGQLTKHDIGSIKVQANETRFELIPDSVKRFLEAVGPGMIVEDTLTITAVDGPIAPNTRGEAPTRQPARAESRERPSARKRAESRDKPRTNKKPYSDAKPIQPKSRADGPMPSESPDEPRANKKPYADAKPIEPESRADDPKPADNRDKPRANKKPYAVAKPIEPKSRPDDPKPVDNRDKPRANKKPYAVPKPIQPKSRPDAPIAAESHPHASQAGQLAPSAREDIQTNSPDENMPFPSKRKKVKGKQKQKFSKHYRAPVKAEAPREMGTLTMGRPRPESGEAQGATAPDAQPKFKKSRKPRPAEEHGSKPGFKYARRKAGGAKDGGPDKNGQGPLKRKKLKKRIR